MSIKDKITPELKDAMLRNIKKTRESGNEHGFFMCADKDGKLSASRTKCEGDSCEIVLKVFPGLCPEKKIQGLFHVHPQIVSAEKLLGRRPTEDDIRDMVLIDKKGNRMIPQTPSHKDVLSILITKCEKSTEGTVCTVGDLEPNRVGCWTPKRGAANLATCYYAKIDNILTKEKGIGPKMWVRPLFEKEIIDLKKDK